MKHLHKELFPILQEYDNGVTRWQTKAVPLFQKGLLEEDGLYALKVSLRGKLALLGVYEGVMCRINDHKLDFLIGRYGVVEKIREYMVDRNGVDEYNYPILRETKGIDVQVRFPDHTGEWHFYNVGEVIGFPRWSVEVESFFK